MNGGWWGLLILIFVLPAMAAGVVMMYLGFHDIRDRDYFGWSVMLVGWFIFWGAGSYGALFIMDNLT